MAKGKQASHWVGFDLGGTKMMAVVYDGKFRVVGRNRKKTKGQKGAAAGIQRMIDVIEGALEEAGLAHEDLGGIGIGSPGPLDLNKGMILETPNLPWSNVPLASALKKHFGCPTAVLNDVDAGVYGEYAAGAGEGARCLFGIFPGTGIGGGCVYEGRILRGAVQSCVEVGHLPMMPNGPLCGCGRRGCLEALASRLAVSSAALAAAQRGQAPVLLENCGGDLSEVRSGALKASVEGGDEVVEAILRDAARWVGVAAGAVVNLLAPDVIVLGGGLVEALPKLYVEEVTRAAEETVMTPFRGTFKVKAALLGDDAATLGAAAWLKENRG